MEKILLKVPCLRSLFFTTVLTVFALGSIETWETGASVEWGSGQSGTCGVVLANSFGTIVDGLKGKRIIIKDSIKLSRAISKPEITCLTGLAGIRSWTIASEGANLINTSSGILARSRSTVVNDLITNGSGVSSSTSASETAKLTRAASAV